ncbi:hypothetical protein ZYGR_0N03860 [Zygosaccharomyces rouxii]|uniref:Inheritance of peroxisomes protein 1 n=2 Tax=Zygosaccharomyces rouxii TaxID=4956 RepID=C5DVT0_ZYGRC|nr:uncharacterized protein ZYRO0D09152g [Zygosaccharomyces rouxii]KAH9200810.1 inheritance of peroxisomes protein 1-domain-containing protein [Zygosaccharomyces rouxii]GAV48981.1 hypothetical protein ZYGR_0N03860 [Zygosaccharomyces rouxii]CAR27899.1 ZYRO0D09152p [Zygosaccharomyces rouxii]
MIGNGTNFIGTMNNPLDLNIPKKRKRDVNRQRLSAHKVSLFQYSNVKAISCTDGNKNTSPLLSNGPLELYQIVTPAPNNYDKSQEMNYLSLGRNGNIVHPILPRLQVKKLKTNGVRFLITFYNPERYWELEFLPNNDDKDLWAIVDDFEKIISKICVYKSVEEIRGENVNENEEKEDDDEDDDEDELDYLLNESEQAQDSNPRLEVIRREETRASRETSTDEFINQAFKRAIRALSNPRDATTNRPRRHSTFIARRPHQQQPQQNDVMSKRFSYQGLPLRIASDPTN